MDEISRKPRFEGRRITLGEATWMTARFS